MALVEGEIIAVGETAADAQARARLSRPQRTATVLYVASPDMIESPSPAGAPRLFASQPAAQQAHAAVLREAPEAVMVGGAVRDLLLDLPVHDLDYVLPGDGLAAARRVADANGWAYYPLDAGRGTGRIIWKRAGEEPFLIDLATQAGGSLEADLRARDFTINAIALLPGGEITDPLAGRQDLEARWLRTCSPASLGADAVRILRGVRMLFTFRLKPAPGLEDLARAAGPGLVDVSAERLRDELCRLVVLPEPHQALGYLAAWGALPLLAPELAALQEVRQSFPHVHGAYEHTLMALRRIARLDRLLRGELRTADDLELTLSASLAPLTGPLRAYLEQELASGRPRWLALRLAALAHDWGKATTATMEAGRTHFHGHEGVSARLAADWFDRYAFSVRERDLVQMICGAHMRPVTLAQAGWTPSRRSLHRLYRDYGSDVAALALLFAADTLATYGPDIDQNLWGRYCAFVAALIEPGFAGDPAAIAPKPLLDGRRIMALTGLPPGPRLGEVLARLQEAQAVGEVTTVAEAEAYVERLA